MGLIFVPALETLLAVWPLQPGTVSWRFGAAGMFSRGLLTSLLGLVLVGGTAVAFGHLRFLKMLALTCGVASVLFLAGSVLLTLDAIQLRANVNPDAKTGYDLAALGAVLKVLHASVATGLVGWGGWRVAQKGAPAPAQRSPEPRMAFRVRPTGGVEPSSTPTPPERP